MVDVIKYKDRQRKKWTQAVAFMTHDHFSWKGKRVENFVTK